MSLTHVCRWDSQNGYVPVSAEEAATLFPERVPARSKMLVCSLCGQSVTFTAFGSNKRHFRHQTKEADKECEDRATQYDNRSSSINSHDMPIRIQVGDDSLVLQMGFFQPRSSGSKNVFFEKMRIKSIDDGRTYEYRYDRLEDVGVTYLKIGDIPSSEYTIDYENPSPSLRMIWPRRVRGVSPKGALFDCKTGRMLQSGGRAYVGGQYYLLQKHALYEKTAGDGLRIEKQFHLPDKHNTGLSWKLYKISVKSFSKEVAHFFLEKSVFLTQRPAEFYPIWPIYVQDPFFIYHEQDVLYFYLSDPETALNAYPQIEGRAKPEYQLLDDRGGRLYKVPSSGRDQLVSKLISIGSYGGTGFSYSVRKSLKMTTLSPRIIVKDLNGHEIQDICKKIPKNKSIIITCQYDGKVKHKKGDAIFAVSQVKAGEQLLVDKLAFQDEVLIYQGFDLIRTISFVKDAARTNNKMSDEELYQTVVRFDGTQMKVDHSIGSMAKDMTQYPKTRNWLLKQIRTGSISIRAYKYIRSLNDSHRKEI